MCNETCMISNVRLGQTNQILTSNQSWSENNGIYYLHNFNNNQIYEQGSTLQIICDQNLNNANNINVDYILK